MQSAWLILFHCAGARANYLLQVMRPALVRQFAESHDAGLWRCLCQILDIPEGQCEATARIASSMPLLLGGIGLRSAVRTSLPTCWASWGDCLHMVHQTHFDIAEVLVNHWEAGGDTPYFSAAVAVATEMGVEGFEVHGQPLHWWQGHHLHKKTISWMRSGVGGNTKHQHEWNDISGNAMFSQS